MSPSTWEYIAFDFVFGSSYICNSVRQPTDHISTGYSTVFFFSFCLVSIGSPQFIPTSKGGKKSHRSLKQIHIGASVFTVAVFALIVSTQKDRYIYIDHVKGTEEKEEA